MERLRQSSMTKTLRGIAIILVIVTGATSLNAQTITLKIANKLYESMRYVEAIDMYEQILKNHRDNREVKLKLATSYRKTKDVKNAVRMYSELAHEDKPSAEMIWYYAQMLSSSGEYDEAAFWYDKYSDMSNDPSGKKFATSNRNIRQFYKDSAKYHVRFAASINSWQSDFSPGYYKNVLVFVSNRKEDVAIKRVSEYDESAFLDYYIASDTSTLYTEMKNGSVPYFIKPGKGSDHPDDTYFTSNDNRTPAHYNNNFSYDSVRYHYDKLTTVTKHNNMSQRFHEGPATVTKGGDTVVMTRNNLYTKGPGGKMINQQALFIAKVKGFDVEEPDLLPFNGPGFSSGHPAFTPDNKLMYFVSNRPGGKGGADIYVVTFDHGHWGTPVNVEELNTKGDEMFPYVDAAGTLYYSSDGMPGMGGLDLFKVKIVNGKVGEIKNLGYPFNSSKDDFGITWDQWLKKGFLSSNRKRGLGDDDIYGFEQVCQSVSVLAYDSITNLPLDSVKIVVGDIEATTDADGRAGFCMNPGDRSFIATMDKYEDRSVTSDRREVPIPLSPIHFELVGTVTSEVNRKPMAGVNLRLLDEGGETVYEIITDNTGKYRFKLALNSNYSIVAAMKSCGTNSSTISTVGLKKSKVLNGDLTLICLGDIIRVENIYYDLNKSAIRKDAEPEMNKLADLMWKYPDMRIELRSHTDSRSSKDFNMRLSANRAEAAVQYLATKGIIPSRMRAAGYGESLPVNKCKDGVKCTEEEYQQNRRTEFKVLSIK